MAEPVLEARRLVKHYGHVLALDEADFSAMPGEVVALIGDNGAGKSTLVKTLVGAIRPDSGEILVDGTPVQLSSPVDARRHGIEAVYQDLALAPDLDAAANLHLGREIYLVPFLKVLDRRSMRRRAERSGQAPIRPSTSSWRPARARACSRVWSPTRSWSGPISRP